MSAAVSFLDVGQGHAAVLTSNGIAAIVDCPFRGVDAVLTALVAEGVEAADAIFVTHRDLDHCAGVPELLERIDVRTLYLNFAWALPPESRARVRVKAVLSSIFSKAERDAVPIVHVYAGDHGAVGDLLWTVLAPTVYDAARATLNDATNRASMVLLLTIADRRFLIMGDADEVTIQNVLDGGAELNADALLVSHHGAQIGNTSQLLDQVDPRFAVISVGRVNGYGHPHVDTLEGIAARATCRLMCTQVNGLCESKSVGESSCAGTVTFFVSADGDLTVNPSATSHGATISGWTSPRCIPT